MEVENLVTHSQAKKVKCNFYFREDISKQICFAETVNPYFRTTPTPCLKIKVVADYTASTLCPRSSQLRANLANYNFFLHKFSKDDFFTDNYR